ncbi:MAG: hypothetical protein MUO76_17540, partial [Anaerolineaceae bacterium]|nr:hypothetical protein [Anaerolineaceae bacterium]
LDILWGKLNLILLLFPGIALLIPLLLFKRIRLTRINIHLLIASVVLLPFHFAWRAQLGIYGDWNLFATVGQVLSILVWYNILKITHMKYKPQILVLLFAIFSIHSYAWITYNHCLTP